MPLKLHLRAIVTMFVLTGALTPALAQDARAVPQNRAQVQLSFAPVVQKASDSVVNVYATKMTVQRDSMFDDPFFSVDSLARIAHSLNGGRAKANRLVPVWWFSQMA